MSDTIRNVRIGDQSFICVGDADAVLDALIAGECDSWLRDRIREAKGRKDFASISCTVASDRYSAGSTAARIALFVLLNHGPDAALDFIADLEHHEGASA